MPGGDMAAFLDDFAAYRFDEALGEWKPYAEVLHQALARCCTRWQIDFRGSDGDAIVAAVPTCPLQASHAPKFRWPFTGRHKMAAR